MQISCLEPDAHNLSMREMCIHQHIRPPFAYVIHKTYLYIMIDKHTILLMLTMFANVSRVSYCLNQIKVSETLSLCVKYCWSAILGHCRIMSFSEATVSLIKYQNPVVCISYNWPHFLIHSMTTRKICLANSWWPSSDCSKCHSAVLLF